MAPYDLNMGEMVLLHHVDGADEHWDLLLEREAVTERREEDETERRLVAFRLSEPLDLTRVAELTATRIGDHRAVYLEYEGVLPAPGGSPRSRGTVRREWRGSCQLHVETPTRLEMTVSLDGRVASFAAERMGAGAGDTGAIGDGWGGTWWFTRM